MAALFSTNLRFFVSTDAARAAAAAATLAPIADWDSLVVRMASRAAETSGSVVVVVLILSANSTKRMMGSLLE